MAFLLKLVMLNIFLLFKIYSLKNLFIFKGKFYFFFFVNCLFMYLVHLCPVLLKVPLTSLVRLLPSSGTVSADFSEPNCC